MNAAVQYFKCTLLQLREERHAQLSAGMIFRERSIGNQSHATVVVNLQPIQSIAAVHVKVIRGRKINMISIRNSLTKGELSSRSRLRIFVQERDGRSCCKCKLTSWMDKPITLWLDHISGNASDNTPENLRLICPNCDSLSDTFGGKNRGNGRASHGLKPWQ